MERKALQKMEEWKNSSHRKFKIAGERPRFTPDWRSMMPPWRPQLNAQEARKLAMEQQHIWHSEKSPALGDVFRQHNRNGTEVLPVY